LSSKLEAEALLLSEKIASSLMLQELIFFTDCLGLARAVAAPGAKNPAALWK
jgi:hypothetical protein